jgi:hypothetical protein
MKVLLKNWLLPNNCNSFLYRKQKALLCFLFFSFIISKGQIANYVSNGGLEDHYPCVFIPNNLSIAKNWRTIDSIPGNIQYCNTCAVYSNVPYNGFGFQYPRTGNSYAMSTFMCQSCASSSTRGYFRNRLKTNLQGGKTYCVKFYVNISNNSSYGIDKFSAYFGNNTLDTITKCLIPLTYINPQIQNPINNFVTDTLGWTLITGTFVATGVEKHMVIGNFKSDANTNKVLINPTNLPSVATDVLIDDVSCIDIDLPAYAAAGSDIWAIPGNTLYLGRPRDVGIDEACKWYKLPNITTAIDTAAGITVTVGITTNTYIVRQEICGNVKWDTVVIHASGVGVSEQELIKNSINVFPNPANDILNVNLNFDLGITFSKIEITNNLGQILREEEINFKNKTATIKTDALENGVYFLQLSSRGTRDIKTDPSYRQDENTLNFIKRFVIAR